MNTYFLSGSTLPAPASFGVGVNGYLIGDAASGLWNFSSGNINLIQSGTSRPTYVSDDAGSLIVSVVDYGLLSLSTSSVHVTGIPLTGTLIFSCIKNTEGTFGINISGETQISTQASGTWGAPGAPFWGGESQGLTTTLYGVMGQSGFGSIQYTAASAATSGVTGCPSGMIEISCLAYLPASAAVILGGWAAGGFASGATAFALSPSTGVGLTFAAGVSGGAVVSWVAPGVTSGLWTPLSSLSGAGFGASLGVDFFLPVSAVVADGGGELRNFSYIGGTITQTQTTTVSGIAPYIGVLNSGVALIPQPSTSSVLGFTLVGNTWTLSGAVVTGVALPAGIAVQGSSALAVYQSGYAVLDPFPVITGTLGFDPQVVTVDTLGNYFIGGNGAAALVSQSGTLLASGVFDATHPAMRGAAYIQGQYFLASSAYVSAFEYQSGLVLMDSVSASIMNKQLISTGSGWVGSSGTPAFSGLLWAQDSLLVPGAGGILEIEIVAPFRPEYRRAGATVIYSGGYGALSGLGIGVTPCQACSDSSGNPRISTLEGYLLTMTSNTVSASSQIWSGGGGLVGMVSGTPGTLWGATTLNSVVIQTS